MALGAVEPSFERDHGVDLRASYAASSDLARQIIDGAPADVYVSASKAWIEQVDKAGKLDGSFVVVARNRLVCIAAPGVPRREPPLSGLRALFDEVEKSGAKIAIADEGVPAGEYARQAMKSVGLLDGYKSSLVGQKDVRAVLKAVESGELPDRLRLRDRCTRLDRHACSSRSTPICTIRSSTTAQSLPARNRRTRPGATSSSCMAMRGGAVLAAHGFGLP